MEIHYNIEIMIGYAKFSGAVRITAIFMGTLLAAAVLAGCGNFQSQPDDPNAPRVMNVAKPDEEGRIAPFQSSGLYTSVWAGRFLDPAPADNMVKSLQERGLSAYMLRKTLAEGATVGFNSTVGDFYLVMAGLFGEAGDARALAGRLKAQGVLADAPTVGVDYPGEIDKSLAQTHAKDMAAGEISVKVQAEASKPLPENSPAKTGEAFKKMVYGRYVGSYRDPIEARDVAESMTRAGWSAAVERASEGGQMWYRVYLAPAEEHRDYAADPKVLANARRSASAQPGIFLLVDTSSLKGAWNSPAPDDARKNSSACAGFSEAGRLQTSINRLMNYIPDTSYIAALVSVDNINDGLVDAGVSKAKDVWNSESGVSASASTAVYGPGVFNRPEMEAAVGRLRPGPDPAALSEGFRKIARDLGSVPGRKHLIVFSEFKNQGDADRARAAFDGLRGAYGSTLRAIFVYGDCDEAGYKLAGDLARAAGGKEAWDGCMLIHNNAYFEKFIKAIFH